MDNASIQANEASVTATINNLPVGTVMPYMGLTENMAGLRAQGWLPCDGTSYLHTEFPHLHKAIGNSNGGDTSRFNVPDLRGVFLRGVDRPADSRDPDSGSRQAQSPGGLTGNNVGTYQGDALKKHTHNTNEWNTSSFMITHSGNDWHPPRDLHSKPSSETGDSSESRPKNVAVYYIIFAGLPAQ
nr:phage tail protein [uncultured Mucilaginibacter sp.]